MVLHHVKRGVDRLLHLIHPTPHDVGTLTSLVHHVDTTHQGRTGNELVPIHDGLLDVPFDLLEHARVNDFTEHTNGVRAEEIDRAVHVLRQAGGDDNDLV